jgi:hypothetical protein
MTDKDWCCEKKLRNWEQVLDAFTWHQRLGGRWVFRGEPASSDQLTTTLDRALRSFGYEKSMDRSTASRFEAGLMRKFQREAHRFGLSHRPAEDDELEWLAWMRHFGAPCRLLDCTYSFLVAVFFALEKMPDEAVVWALNPGNMGNGFRSILQETGSHEAQEQYRKDPMLLEKKTFRSIFLASPPVRVTATLNPFHLNERLVIQQGVFLCPGDVSIKLSNLVRDQILMSQVDADEACIKY